MPSPDTDRPIGIIVAVQEELRALLKRAVPAVVESGAQFTRYRTRLGGREVVISPSGMGPDRASQAAHELISICSPALLLAAGFCAGISPAVEPGEVIWVEQVSELLANGALSQSLPSDSATFPISSNLGVCGGAMVSASGVVRTSQEKQALNGLVEDGIGLDMETYAIAKSATAAGVPWHAIRAISDGMDDDLPIDFTQFTNQLGEIDRFRLATWVALRPWKIPAFIRLGARSAVAARNLAVAVEAFLRALPNDPDAG